MGKDCCLGLFLVFLVLGFLEYLVVAIFLVPIKGQCDKNSTIDNGATIAISMNDWIYGGMGMAITVFIMIVSTARSKTQNDCAIGLLVVFLILYHLFMLGWSIVGFIIFEDYYKGACSGN